MAKLIKRVLKKGIYCMMSNELVLGYSRKKRLINKIVVLMYHEVAEDADDIEAWTVVRKSDFLRHLKTHFEVVSIEEALSRKGHASTQKPLAVVTFDDGYAGNRKNLLPIAESLGLPVSIFVSTGAVISRELYWYDKIITAVQTRQAFTLSTKDLELGDYSINKTSGAGNWAEIQRLLSALKALEPVKRNNVVKRILETLEMYERKPHYKLSHLTENDIRELAASRHITLGAHSHCHNILPQLDQNMIKKSVRTSKVLIEKWTNCRVKYFAYPNGNYDANVINALTDSGFECSFTTTNKPWGHEQLFEIPRIGVGRYDSFDLFKAKVSNAFMLF